MKKVFERTKTKPHIDFKETKNKIKNKHYINYNKYNINVHIIS